jgi:epoxyqueuosine reductase
MEDVRERAALSASIRRLAAAQGIDVFGFAEASGFESYLSRRSKRRDPRLSLSDAKTIIVVGIYVGGFVLPSWDTPSVGRTSRLILSGFFNDVVRPLEPIATSLRHHGYTALICDDSRTGGSILPLKLAAIRAGLGWQGKTSLLVTQKYGTFLALGGIVTNAVLEHNAEEETNRCKGCTRCQRACPVQALEQPYVLDTKKCLSCLLQHDSLPEEAVTALGNRVMDCEICQQVCPWNTRHIERPLVTARSTAFQAQVPAWEDFFALPRLAALTRREYASALGHLNTRIPYRIFHRNVLMALEHLSRRQPRAHPAKRD